MKCELLEDVSLCSLSSWKVGGVADYLVYPLDVEELRESLIWAKENGQKVSVLGGGSNVLISDKGVKGLVIHTKYLSGIEEKLKEGQWHLDCLAGTSKYLVLKSFLKKKLDPAIFLTGLPGNVGGGVVMNAGIGGDVVPREFGEIVNWVDVLRMDGKMDRIQGPSLKWGYRQSQGWQPSVIVRVGLSWPMYPRESLMEDIKKVNRHRVVTQPIHQPSCGSVFRNPKPYFAGEIIESCGLKGLQIGGAEVSRKHANFIVAHLGAKAMDIYQLIESVRLVVWKKKSIHLETEVIYMGEFD